MPENRLKAAANHIETDVISRMQGARHLTAVELAAHGAHFKVGWELPALLSSSRHQLRLLLPDRFPFARPRIAIYPIEPVLTWPHLEENGLLCLAGDNAPHSPEKPTAEVVDVLGRSRTLVDDSLAGKGHEHFEDEFVSYWNRWANEKKMVRSLCCTNDTSRWVRVWYGKAITVIAENDDLLRMWINGCTSSVITDKNFTSQRIPFIWPTVVPRPAQYPTTVGKLLELVAGDTLSASLIEEMLLDNIISNKDVLIGVQTRRGVGLGIVHVLNPATPKGSGNPLTRGGFRGSIPKSVLLPRYMSAKVTGSNVTRVDAAWVHGRDHNADVDTLSSKSVVVLGIGSVGSPITTLLAQAGVGKIDLVDPQTLDSENTGRHELGVNSVGLAKAVQLATELRRRFPHLMIQAHKKTWQQVANDNSTLLTSADLIISAMGNWSLESDLNAFALAQSKFTPVLYGWTEPHATAGHAVVFMDRTACLRCLTDDMGEVRLPVTAWKNETMKAVPACGGSFQPYGAIELAHTNAMIAELVLDVLTGRTHGSSHRMWAGRRAVLERAGGAWNPKWIKIYGDPGESGRLIEGNIANNPQCPECQLKL